jgi:TonB family protein
MIARVLFDGLWQGTAIVAIAHLTARAVSKRNASTRYAVWFSALVALLVIPVLSTFSDAGSLLFAALSPHAQAGRWTIALLPRQPFVRDAGVLRDSVMPWLVSAWSAGVAICLLRLTFSQSRIARIRRAAAPSQLGSDVSISTDVTMPIAVGIIHPAIVLPKGLAEMLAPADLERVLAHERAHLRRHDVAGNFVQRLIEALLFFNPWVHLAGRALMLEREAACDDWAVAKTGTADDYATLLASLAVRLRHPQTPLATPSALGSRRALIARIERLSGDTGPALSLNYYIVGGTAMLFVILTLVLEAFSPALAFAPAQTLAQSGTNAVAAACANPNVDATVTSPAEPKIPQGLNVEGSSEMQVTIAPNGSVEKVTIWKSSGYATIDRAVAQAAMHSKYSPKRVNCRPVAGTYLFRADFKPDGQ